MSFLDLSKYKMMKCPNMEVHNKKKCPYFHEEKKDKRRPIGTYSAMMCPNIDNPD